MDLKVHDLKVHGAGLRRAVADVMRGGVGKGLHVVWVWVCARARVRACVRIYECSPVSVVNPPPPTPPHLLLRTRARHTNLLTSIDPIPWPHSLTSAADSDQVVLWAIVLNWTPYLLPCTVSVIASLGFNLLLKRRVVSEVILAGTKVPGVDRGGGGGGTVLHFINMGSDESHFHFSLIVCGGGGGEGEGVKVTKQCPHATL